MTFEELQINLNLVFDVEDKKKILEDVASRCRKRYFFVDDNGKCYLFDKNGDLDDIRKIKILRESYIRQDIKKIKIPIKVTSISDFAFSNCINLTSVTIPNSITNIGSFAFSNCSSLKSVMIPDSVTSIGSGAFNGCKDLKSVIISDGVMSIGSSAFYYCTNLTSVTIPNSVININYQVFENCKNLKELIFKGKTFDEVKSMKNYPFGIEDESIIKVE